jgi:hypothetical protein
MNSFPYPPYQQQQPQPQQQQQQYPGMPGPVMYGGGMPHAQFPPGYGMAAMARPPMMPGMPMAQPPLMGMHMGIPMVPQFPPRPPFAVPLAPQMICTFCIIVSIYILYDLFLDD